MSGTAALQEDAATTAVRGDGSEIRADAASDGRVCGYSVRVWSVSKRTWCGTDRETTAPGESGIHPPRGGSIAQSLPAQSVVGPGWRPLREVTTFVHSGEQIFPH